MLQSIELFSGSGTVSAILKEYGFNTRTVDWNPNYKPDICADIQTIIFDERPGTVQFIWASPDCAKLSRAASQSNWSKKTISYRNYEYTPLTQAAILSLNLVFRTVEIIKQLNPGVWFIENPVGRIQHLPGLRSIGHYRYAVNYKDWGFPYSKETYIFTNQLLPLPTVVPLRTGAGLRSISSPYLRALVPPRLIHFLIQHSNFQGT